MTIDAPAEPPPPPSRPDTPPPPDPIDRPTVRNAGEQPAAAPDSTPPPDASPAPTPSPDTPQPPDPIDQPTIRNAGEPAAGAPDDDPQGHLARLDADTAADPIDTSPDTGADVHADVDRRIADLAARAEGDHPSDVAARAKLEDLRADTELYGRDGQLLDGAQQDALKSQFLDEVDGALAQRGDDAHVLDAMQDVLARDAAREEPEYLYRGRPIDAAELGDGTLEKVVPLDDVVTHLWNPAPIEAADVDRALTGQDGSRLVDASAEEVLEASVANSPDPDGFRDALGGQSVSSRIDSPFWRVAHADEGSLASTVEAAGLDPEAYAEGFVEMRVRSEARDDVEMFKPSSFDLMMHEEGALAAPDEPFGVTRRPDGTRGVPEVVTKPLPLTATESARGAWRSTEPLDTSPVERLERGRAFEQAMGQDFDTAGDLAVAAGAKGFHQVTVRKGEVRSEDGRLVDSATGRLGRMDHYAMSQDGGYAVIVEDKSTNWRDMRDDRVGPNVTDQIRQINSYINSPDTPDEICAFVQFPEEYRPVDAARSALIERRFNEHGIGVVWTDATRAAPGRRGGPGTGRGGSRRS
jgi:hypothetical protein